MPATTRFELVLSAALAVTCHAAFFGFMPEGIARPPEVRLSTQRENLEVTLVPVPVPVRERIVEPVRVKREVPAREAARTPAREKQSPVARTVREPVRDRRRAEAREKVVEPVRRKPVARKVPPRAEERKRSEKKVVQAKAGNSANDAAARDATYVLKTPHLVYPRWALDLGYEGRAIVLVRVTAAGTVAEVKLKRGSGHRHLDNDAFKQVRENLIFQPARSNGRPVESWKEIAFNYFLRDGAPSIGNE